jgi:muconolactone delta-isomerase
VNVSTRDRLRVRVNDELVLDAGTCEEVSGPHGPERLIRPPETTLFHQVLAYLRAKPEPPTRFSGTMVGREGVAAAALVLRWGSYLAVLLDRDKPVWPEVRAARTSRISDAEMARINIEASAALAEWIDLYRRDPGGRIYAQLVDRAVCSLPMPRKTSKLKVSECAALADAEMAVRVVQASDAARLARVRADAERYPSRLLANALVNVAWRNGPVEHVHAGGFRGYPLTQRRVTPTEERELMRFASDGMALGMTVCLQFAMERPQRSWPEQVLPFGLAEILMITPSRWTLTDASREVRLPA